MPNRYATMWRGARETLDGKVPLRELPAETKSKSIMNVGVLWRRADSFVIHVRRLDGAVMASSASQLRGLH